MKEALWIIGLPIFCVLAFKYFILLEVKIICWISDLAWNRRQRRWREGKTDYPGYSGALE